MIDMQIRLMNRKFHPALILDEREYRG